MLIRVDLDTVKKYRNKQEWRPVQRARILSHDLEVVGDGPIIKHVCKLFTEKYPQIDAYVEVFRGDTCCFEKTPISAFMRSTVGAGKQPEWLRRKN